MSEVSQSAPASAVEEKIETVGEALAEPVLGSDVAQPTPPVAAESAEVTPDVEEPTVAGAQDELLDAPAAVAESAAVAEAPTADLLPVEEVAAEAVAVVAEEAVVEVAVAEAAPAGEPLPAAESGGNEGEVAGDGKGAAPKPKNLAVGQEVMGTVKRVSDFGAFVDIGVGRDGLVHISELSIKRVGKVTDVLNEGQVVPMWIKKLDRERNRISLTMIPPGTKTLRDVNQGDIVTGTVTRILPYGAFVDIGVGRDALLHVREMGERYIAKPEEVVTVGEELEARIIEVQRRRGRIDLSIKGLRPEPEVENSPYSQQEQSGQGGSGYQGGSSHQGGQSYSEPTAQVDAAPEPVDQFADMEMPSAMELALRKAMDQSGVELKISKKKDKQRAEQKRKQQEDIYERTLKSSGK